MNLEGLLRRRELTILDCLPLNLLLGIYLPDGISGDSLNTCQLLNHLGPLGNAQTSMSDESLGVRNVFLDTLRNGNRRSTSNRGTENIIIWGQGGVHIICSYSGPQGLTYSDDLGLAGPSDR